MLFQSFRYNCYLYFMRIARLVQSMATVWRAPVPCKIGDHLHDLDTPALIVDMNKMERNLKILPEIMKKYPNVAVRPHAKAHKCPAIARLQIAHGAVGVCCQTLTEAEAMIYGEGTSDVFVSNQIIGKKKLRRLAQLADKGDLSVCVDELGNIKDIAEVCGEAGGVKLGLVVEVNVGQDRCGVEPGNPAVVLAKEIMKLPHVYFKGIQCYQGWNQHVRKATDRKTEVGKVIEYTKQTLKAFEDEGIECNYVTGGGTGTFPYEAESKVFTEVQPGSYVVMDADYGRNYDAQGDLFHDFENSLFVLSTVQSTAAPGRAVLDAGMKAVSLDSGPPLLNDYPDLQYSSGGDEHGIVKPCGSLTVGKLVWLIPGHCDPTVNLYDWIVGVRNSKVETIWPIQGRGPGV